MLFKKFALLKISLHFTDASRLTPADPAQTNYEALTEREQIEAGQNLTNEKEPLQQSYNILKQKRSITDAS